MGQKDCFPIGLVKIDGDWAGPLLGWASFTIPPSKIFRLFDHVK